MDSFFAVIEENRNAFMAYTIARLRELLRNLSPDRADLFQSLPFLIHINLPGFPGYLPADHPFYGITRFEQSGFFKHALRHFKLDPETLEKKPHDEAAILGLYLMGSAGTLTQTRNSDFDFWVIVEEERLGPTGLKLLGQKLTLIETWCRQHHQQDVTFFIMDIAKLRRNEFSTVSGESSGSAQRTLLKDEFYRTFIMIAGKIPLWAVLPPDIPEHIPAEAILSLSNEDYIDTGDLTGIDSRECLGAVLWQVYKARKDPVKSLIKSSLAAFYAFNASDSGSLISARVKAAFSKTKLDDYLCDPYVTVFDAIISFYTDMDDRQGLTLIRQCIILRLLSYPIIEIPDTASPKGRLLARFVESWDQGRADLERLSSARSWSENDRIAFEDTLFDKLSFLFELIFRSTEDDGAVITMNAEDLTILKNRTAAFVQKKPGKIPRCSTFLRVKARDLSLWVGPTRDQKGSWSVYGQGDPVPLFTGPEYLKTLGWIFANTLNQARFITRPRNFLRIKAFLDGLFPLTDTVFSTPPQIKRIVILFKGSEPGIWSAADHLIINSWGEFYFDSIELSDLESLEQKCYKTAEFIFASQLKNPDSNLEYLICRPEGDHHSSLDNIVRDQLDMLAERSTSKGAPSERGTFPPENTALPGKPKPFLDLL